VLDEGWRKSTLSSSWLDPETNQLGEGRCLASLCSADGYFNASCGIAQSAWYWYIALWHSFIFCKGLQEKCENVFFPFAKNTLNSEKLLYGSSDFTDHN